MEQGKGRAAGDLFAGHENLTAVRLEKPTDQIEECALARAVRSDDGVEFSGHHVETDAVGGPKTAKGLAQIDDTQDRFPHGLRPSMRPITPLGNSMTSRMMVTPRNKAQYSVKPVSQVCIST